MPDVIGCKKPRKDGKQDGKPVMIGFSPEEVAEIVKKTKYETLKKALEIHDNAFTKMPSIDAEQVIAKAREEALEAEEKIRDEVAQSALVPVFDPHFVETTLEKEDLQSKPDNKPKFSVIKKKGGVQINRWKS